MPLERDTLRRFVQAIMDQDPPTTTKTTREEQVRRPHRPPLYPVHAFRLPADVPDPLDASRAIQTPTALPASWACRSVPGDRLALPAAAERRERDRVLPLAARRRARRRAPKYADVTLKEGKSGAMLLVTVETRSPRSPASHYC